MNKPFKNYGVKIGNQPADWAGGTIPYEERNPSGDWNPYLVVGELQRNPDYSQGDGDWMDCTIRSGTNCIEIQEKFFTGVEPNYNDREVAIGAKVTREGAYTWQGAEYIRTTGLAQQSTWPDSKGNWDEQYTLPADSIWLQLSKEKKEWMKKWEILHENLTDLSQKSLQYHLKHAPLQVLIPGHAITLVSSIDQLNHIFDSYPPYLKDVPGEKYSGPIISAKKIVLYKKSEALDPDILLVDLKYGEHGSQILRLKRALKRLGWTLSGIEANEGWDVYNDKIADLVMRYKLANVCDSYWARAWERLFNRGHEVEAATRININNNLKNR